MSDDELMGLNAYARHRGCAPNAVVKAERSGRIKDAVVRDKAGEFVGIKYRLADELWALNTDPDQAARNGKFNLLSAGIGGPESSGVNAAAASVPAPIPAELPLETTAAASVETPADVPANDVDAISRDPHGYLEARATREKYNAKQAELDYLKAIGQVVAVEEMKKVSARRYRAIRDQLLGVPDRMAWLSREDRTKLTQEIRRVLHELSNDARAEIAGGVAERVAA